MVTMVANKRYLISFTFFETFKDEPIPHKNSTFLGQLRYEITRGGFGPIPPPPPLVSDVVPKPLVSEVDPKPLVSEVVPKPLVSICYTYIDQIHDSPVS